MQIYKSTKCNDMRQTGYCPRGPFCAFAHVESKSIFFLFYLLKNVFLIAISHLLVYIWTIPGIPSTEETMNSLLTAIQSGSQAQLGSQQYLEGPVGEWNSGGSSSTTSSNGQLGSVGSFLFYFENSLTQLGHKVGDGAHFWICLSQELVRDSVHLLFTIFQFVIHFSSFY